MKAVFLVLLVPVSVLAASPEDIKAEKRVDALSSPDFCRKLGPAIRLPIGRDEAYRSAMLRRAERSEKITSVMQGAIAAREPAMGMNLCAVVAAFGQPDRHNRSVTQHGESYQLIYERPRRYIYMTNHKVTAWQD
jgi:hypothetical protein